MGIFERHPWLVVILILLAMAFAGTMDYEDARRSECADQGRSYNSQKDVCE